jgi:Interferon-induced transmembrane protein
MSDYGSTPPPPPPAPPYPYGAAGAQGYPPPNYLVWAILCTVLCCLPLGIASIVFSTQVNSKWEMGDVAGAQGASGKAKTFAIWGAIVGVIVDILSVVFAVALGGMGTDLNTGTWF